MYACEYNEKYPDKSIKYINYNPGQVFPSKTITSHIILISIKQYLIIYPEHNVYVPVMYGLILLICVMWTMGDDKTIMTGLQQPLSLLSITHFWCSATIGTSIRLQIRAPRFTRVSWLPSLADTSAILLRRAWCNVRAALVDPPATPTIDWKIRIIKMWAITKF